MDDPRQIDWFDIRRLLAGTLKQQSAARALLALDLQALPGGRAAVLCGTVPIRCDLPESDLDIICETHDPAALSATLRGRFAGLPEFELRGKDLNGAPSVICRFRFEGWPVEIIGQPVPVARQRAFGHMLAEALLLYGAPPGANELIRALKRRGLTTEEAFASHFGLPGDPYEALFALYENNFSLAAPA